MAVKTISDSLTTLPHPLGLLDAQDSEPLQTPLLNLQILCPCGDTHIIPLSNHNSTQTRKDTIEECDLYKHYVSNKGILNKEGGYRKVMVVIEKNLR